MKTIALTTAALLAVPALAVAGTSAAFAHDDDRGHDRGDDRTRAGSCTGSTRWEIEAGPDDGRLEVEAEVDGRRAGQRWAWTLRQDGKLVDSGRARTHGRSGSFEVERKLRNTRGADRLVFRAVRANGEVCVARVTA